MAIWGAKSRMIGLAHINYYCIILVPQVFNSHVLTDRNPFINKAIHVLLIHGFATFFTLVPGQAAKHVLSLQINTTNHENLTTARIEHL